MTGQVEFIFNRRIEKQRIKFDETKFQINEYIKQSIVLCETYGGFLEIDINFCVYVIYDGGKHWIGYAKPYDMDWFDAQFAQ